MAAQMVSWLAGLGVLEIIGLITSLYVVYRIIFGTYDHEPW